MRKLTKKSLDELAMIMPAILDGEQRSIIGGTGVYGDKDCPYTQAQYEEMAASGTWTGGYVEGWGYTTADAEVTGNKSTTYPFNDFQLTYAFSEGVGLTGSFFVDGGVRIENGMIIVSAAALGGVQGVIYSGKIELIVNGSITETNFLKNPSNGTIGKPNYIPIGLASFDKSRYGDAKIQVKLTVSYTLNSGSGNVAPVCSYEEIIYSSNN